MKLVAELIPVNAKMSNCFLSTVPLQDWERRDKSSVFSAIHGFLPSSVTCQSSFLSSLVPGSRRVFYVASVSNKMALREETQPGRASGFAAAFL